MIDEFLSIYDFSATYEVHIDAPASVVYQRLLRSDFNDLWLVRLLITIRTGKLHFQNRVPRDLHERLQGTGFVILEAVREQELVIGVAGRFWRPDGGRCLNLNASDFVEFSRPGCAKAAWNFKLTPQSPQSTVFSTETRIKCFGSAAFWKFRLYWTLVKPFSGLIRKAILKQVKSAAESAFTAT